MTQQINIKINRSGFPVKFGEIELWFDMSLERIETFRNIEEIANSKIKETQKKVEEWSFETDEKTYSDEVLGKVVEFDRENIKTAYDLVFGEGSFDKLYEVYPDIQALADAFEQAAPHIQQRIIKYQKDRVDKVENVKKEYLEKKNKKIKKK